MKFTLTPTQTPTRPDRTRIDRTRTTQNHTKHNYTTHCRPYLTIQNQTKRFQTTPYKTQTTVTQTKNKNQPNPTLRHPTFYTPIDGKVPPLMAKCRPNLPHLSRTSEINQTEQLTHHTFPLPLPLPSYPLLLENQLESLRTASSLAAESKRLEIETRLSKMSRETEKVSKEAEAQAGSLRDALEASRRELVTASEERREEYSLGMEVSAFFFSLCFFVLVGPR